MVIKTVTAMTFRYISKKWKYDTSHKTGIGTSDTYQYAFLDVVHAIMVFLEDLACSVQVQVLLTTLAPRQVGEPVEVVASDTATHVHAGSTSCY